MSEYKRVKTCKCHIPVELHDAFKKKIIEEGWTIQQALTLLIKSYVEDNFDIEDKE